MSSQPLVSVIVPTFNSEAHLKVCLESVRKQSYQKIELIIVDSHSRDRTVEIAKKYGVVIPYSGALLGARYLGAVQASGEYILLLDSDQILERTSVSRAIDKMSDFDLLCFEEKSYAPKTFTAKLFEADRELVNKCSDLHLDPVSGVMLARFYKKRILYQAFSRIPKNIMPVVIAHDHAILYYEAYKLSSRVGIVNNAVWHIEPSSIIKLFQKNYRYGKSTKPLLKAGVYNDLLQQKTSYRKGTFIRSNFNVGVKSLFLLCLKAIPYEIGLLI